jgi:hypothetical protein
MPLFDISIVTKSLKRFLEEYFRIKDTTRTVSPESPENLAPGELGLYLYHISEDAHFKNLPSPGQGETPVRYVPMGLNLYYQLTAHGASDDDDGAFDMQKMIGIAAKAFHDYPVIDNSTEIEGQDVFPADESLYSELGRDNRLRIALQPIPHNEAVSYWTAGSQPLRLAVYYQVSVVLLEPEEETSRPGRVLTYGVHTYVEGAPRLDASQNTISFTIPEQSTQREIELRPAQVPIDSPPGSSVTSDIAFTGSGLVGDGTSLLLRNNLWDEPVEADQAWDIVVTSNRISAVVRETASGKDVLPGVYSAFVKVTRRHAMSDGSVRDLEHSSNECPFLVTPRVVSITGPDGSNEWTVSGYPFEDPNPPPVPPPPAHPPAPRIRSVQVYIGNFRLEFRESGTLNPGQFSVSNPQELKLRLPPDLDAQKYYPVRIFVNGAESPPNWIKTP